GVAIGPGVYIGPHAQLGDGCVLHAGAVVMDDVVLGPGCVLWPHAVVRERCTLGARCILHPGAVIGADGFGYRPEKGPDGVRIRKVPQIGVVTLGDDVEIGANSGVDRAKFDATVVGEGSKIDNLVQIGHNCRIGNHVVIAGCCGIGGSCVIGDYAMLGGMVMMRDHVSVGVGAKIAGGAAVIEDVPPGESWGGYPAGPMKQKIKEELAVRRLPDLLKLAKAWLPDK
ncbi:MAG: UDP-3-O-(3-hydroxymyristoyl)glucosamine N-acyltransferase, partial [Planctomycetota bacterium]